MGQSLGGGRPGGHRGLGGHRVGHSGRGFEWIFKQGMRPYIHPREATFIAVKVSCPHTCSPSRRDTQSSPSARAGGVPASWVQGVPCQLCPTGPEGLSWWDVITRERGRGAQCQEQPAGRCRCKDKTHPVKHDSAEINFTAFVFLSLSFFNVYLCLRDRV